ncbi:MAG: CAP domain-containing protein, partial [Smithella sp.]
MTGMKDSGFWKQHGIVIGCLVVIVFIIVFTNIPALFNFFQNAAGNGSPDVLQQFWYSGSSILPAVSREILTREAVIALTNKARFENGFAPLAENQLLNLIAESRARDMLEKQYFAHVSPTGQQVSDIAQNIGYHYKIISENIGSGDFYTNQKMVDGWMQSPGHRNNILSPEVQEIGVAVLKGRLKGAKTYVAVQIFGLQSLPVAQNICVAPSDNLRHEIDMKKAEIETLQDQLDRLKNELDAEQESIETDQKYTYTDARKVQKLNERINAFNEKSRWYNRLVGEAKANVTVMES